MTFEEALELQCLAANFKPLEGYPLHQPIIELVGGPADGVTIEVRRGTTLMPTFKARGAYDDGTGKETAEYRRAKRVLHLDAAPITFYEFAGLPVK